MEGERHNTHIVSYSSAEEQNKLDKINTELKSSIQQESEKNDIIPIQKIKIKDLFKNFDKREKNQIIQFEENEEEIIVNEEEIKYMKDLKKKNSLRKNITHNLKDWIDKRKQMQEINTENFELIENKTDTKNNNDENIKNEGTQTHNIMENGANEDNNTKTSNIDSDQIGNPSNKTNSKNNKDILNTNKENRMEGEFDKKSNKKTNEANKDNNLNENNEESDDNDLDNNKDKEKYKKYNESNFNFYLLNNQNEENKDIKNKSEIENNFNSSAESNYVKENDYDDIKTKDKKISIKKKPKNNSLNKNNIINRANYIKNVPNKKDKSKTKTKSKSKSKSKSTSKSHIKENKYSFYGSNNNYWMRSITKENNTSLNKKLKNSSITEKNNSIRSYNRKSNKNKIINKKEISKYKNNINQFNRNKLRTSGDNSTKNKNNNKLINLASPKNNNIKKIKKETILPIPRKCYFTKKIIQMNSEHFNLLNEKIRKGKEKNKIFHKQRTEYNSLLFKNNNLTGRNELYDDLNDYENINTQDLLRDNNNQMTYINNNALNNYMNKRIISPNILINRHLTNLTNRKTNQKKVTDISKSPYLINKYNVFQKSLNKSNSAINFYNNKHSSHKFPNIINNHKSLKSQNSNMYQHNNINDLNLNFLKSSRIFNFNPKNNIFIPIKKARNSEEIKSANSQRFQNSNFKIFGLSTPIAADMANKINVDMKYLQNAKKLFNPGDKGYGRHYGNEKDCPICQAMQLKSNYNMKNMVHYHEFIKQKDQDTIKFNKEQFLQELKKPSTSSQRKEASILKEIKQFINNSKKSENMYNNYKNDSSIINAYFV